MDVPDIIGTVISFALGYASARFQLVGRYSRDPTRLLGAAVIKGLVKIRDLRRFVGDGAKVTHDFGVLFDDESWKITIEQRELEEHLKP